MFPGSIIVLNFRAPKVRHINVTPVPLFRVSFFLLLDKREIKNYKTN